MVSLIPHPSGATLPLTARGSRVLPRSSSVRPALELQWVLRREQLGMRKSVYSPESCSVVTQGRAAVSAARQQSSDLSDAVLETELQIAAAWNALMENWPKCLILFCSAKLRVPTGPDEKARRVVPLGAGPFVSILLNGFSAKCLLKRA